VEVDLLLVVGDLVVVDLLDQRLLFALLDRVR